MGGATASSSGTSSASPASVSGVTLHIGDQAGTGAQALTGLRQSLGVAWLALVVAEQVNASAGLGFMISQATQFLRNDVILVALAVYAVLGLITDALVRLLERRALAWRRGILG